MLSVSHLFLESRLNVAELKLHAGEIYLVLGSNGAGKSTLLSVLAGLETIEGAQIEFTECSLSGMSVDKRAEVLAVLTQQQAMSFEFTVREIVLMGAYPLHLTDRQQQERLEFLAERLTLTPLLDRNYLTLSRGEKQRVQVARVLMQRSVQPGLIFMDEPLTALDLRQKLQVMQLLKEIKSEGHTLLLVVHDLNLAAEFGDSFLLMKQGQIIARGDADQVLNEQQLSALYETRVERIASPAGPPQFRAVGNIS